jgi:hypothetical protein
MEKWECRMAMPLGVAAKTCLKAGQLGQMIAPAVF